MGPDNVSLAILIQGIVSPDISSPNRSWHLHFSRTCCQGINFSITGNLLKRAPKPCTSSLFAKGGCGGRTTRSALVPQHITEWGAGSLPGDSEGDKRLFRRR